MPCDGSHVLFIGGYHHSGTGAVTHALKVHALGLHSPGIDAEVRFSYGSIYYYLALKAAGATSDNPHSGHQHELHPYPFLPRQAKHGYGRCTHPHVESDVCQWPGNAQRFMQALGLTK